MINTPDIYFDEFEGATQDKIKAYVEIVRSRKEGFTIHFTDQGSRYSCIFSYAETDNPIHHTSVTAKFGGLS